MINRNASPAIPFRPIFKSRSGPSPLPSVLAGPQAAVRRQPSPLPAFQIARLRARIGAVTCSEPWSETAMSHAQKQGVNPANENIARQLADRGIYPPPVDAGPNQRLRRGAVRMRRCDACGRIVPPNNVAEHLLVRLCDDCRIEPATDLDESANESQIARAPGAQSRLWVEGLTDADANRNTARQTLMQMGLTEPEVMALSLMHAGYSTRRIADLGRWSQTYVRKLLQSAGKKLRRSGLKVPQPERQKLPRCRPVDPTKLAATASAS